MPVFQINFSRPAGQIIAQYYNFLRLGREGYQRIHQASYDTGQYLAAEIVKLGPFELLCDSNPADRDPDGDLADPRGRGPRLHPVRPGRPAAHPGAGRCPPTP